MKRSIVLVVLIIVFIGSIYIYKSSEDGGEPTRSITWDGLERTYRIHIPPSYDETKPAPVVIALHGGGGKGKNMQKLTLGGFNRLADREGFIVVYPDGIGRHWNDGREGVNYRAHREKIDDAGFISALIDRLTGELNIDRERVYATGISNGAMMSYRLACELPEKFAAIAPVAGAMPLNLSSRCSTSRPVPVLIIDGKDDPMVPWEGGNVRLGPLKLGKISSVPETVDYWVTRDNCSSPPSVAQETDTHPQDGTKIMQEVYTGCAEGSEVILYTIEGGGHTWPGGYQYLPEIIVGKTSRDMDASEVIWAFFKKQAIR